MSHVLVADDKDVMVRFLAEFLAGEGHSVTTASDGREALAKFRAESPEIVITDMKMPKLSGLELLREIKRESPETVVIVMTAFATIESAVETMKAGAYDYILKPFSIDQIRAVLGKVGEKLGMQREITRLKGELAEKFRFENMIATSGPMQAVCATMAKVLDNRTTVLIVGETGTGKELIARAIHYNGPRRDKPFVKVNCAALPETLLEAELFGHEKGAFTGADRRREGRFELADGGTLFLDEIGEIPLSVQVKLLRVLQHKEFERVGSSETISVDVRILAATNADLEAGVEAGTFRRDLFYRLNVVPIRVPPLRERAADIPLLAEHFLARQAKELGRRFKGFTRDALNLLLGYAWPGNVRELENLVERACIMSERETLDAADFPAYLGEREVKIPLTIPSVGVHKLDEAVEQIERRMIEEALGITGGQQSRAAEILGLTRGTLIYKMKKYGFASKGEDKA